MLPKKKKKDIPKNLEFHILTFSSMLSPQRHLTFVQNTDLLFSIQDFVCLFSLWLCIVNVDLSSACHLPEMYEDQPGSSSTNSLLQALSMLFLGSRVLRAEGPLRSCPENVQFRYPLWNFPASSVWPCSLALFFGPLKVKVIMARRQPCPLPESIGGSRVFPCVQTSCVKLNKSQYLWVSFSKHEEWGLQHHTYHKILPN